MIAIDCIDVSVGGRKILHQVSLEAPAGKLTAIIGIPISNHWKKVTSTPSGERMNPIPIRLGGVPTRVVSPPIEAANEVISISALAYRGSRSAPAARERRAARIESPMPNIIAVVAVLEIQAEMSAVAAPKATRILAGRAPTQGTDSTA